MKSRNLVFLAVLAALVMAVWLPTAAHADSATHNNATAVVKYKVYVVKKGDTLGVIARRFGVPVATIIKVNKLGSSSRIYVGQKLRIPIKKKPAQKPAQQQQKNTQKNQKKQKAIKQPSSNVRPPNTARWIEIDLSQQRLYAHENGQVVFSTLISSGRRPYRTPIGRFRVWAKVRRQTMSGPGYRLPNVQWVMYFAGENAIHGTYWHNNFGHPMSHGCVNATNKAAQWLYNWSPPSIPVIVHR